VQKILYQGNDPNLFRLNPDTLSMMSAWEDEHLCQGVAAKLGINIEFSPRHVFRRQKAEIIPYLMNRIETIQVKKHDCVVTYDGAASHMAPILMQIEHLIQSLPVRDKVLMTREIPDAVLHDLHGKNYLAATGELLRYDVPYVRGAYNIPRFNEFFYVSYCSTDITDDVIKVLAMF